MNTTKRKKGLTAVGLHRATPPYIRNNAKSVVIKKLTPTHTKGGMLALRAVAQDMGKRQSKPHKCHVIGLDKDIQKIINSRQPVQVHCSCEFYTYTCEYALFTWGNAKIISSNGEPAHTTNPGNHPLLCKHLVALLAEAKRLGY